MRKKNTVHIETDFYHSIDKDVWENSWTKIYGDLNCSSLQNIRSKSVDFHRFKDMDLVELIHIFGLKNIHTFGPIISLIRLFSLMLNYDKPRLTQQCNFISGNLKNTTTKAQIISRH